MEFDLNFIITELMKLCIPILVGFVIAFLKKHGILKAIESKEKYAKMAVHAAEELYKDYDGATKYHYALDWLSQQLKNAGIKFSEDELDGLIHSAVNRFKQEVNQPKQSAFDPGTGGR